MRAMVALGLLSGCAVAPQLPVNGPAVLLVTPSGDRVPLGPDGGCIEEIHVPGSRGGHDRLLRNSILVRSGTLLADVLRDDPPAAARAARARRMSYAGFALLMAGALFAPLAEVGGAMLSTPGDDEPKGKILLGVGITFVPLIVTGTTLAALGYTQRRESIREYNAWSVAHGCEH
jgi:hypothetical protein